MPYSTEAEDPLRWGKSVPNQAWCRFVLMAVVEVPTSCEPFGCKVAAVVHSMGREHLGVDGTVWHSEISVFGP